MSKKAILISFGSAFLVGAIRDNIVKAGYRVIDVAPVIKEFNKIKFESDVIFFYLGNFLGDCNEFLVYLRDICIEEEKTLFVIGSSNEFQELSATISDNIIAKKFERPINIKDLLEALDDYSSQK
ncbi:MAG: hypothetical protein J6N47_06285 [Lachnospiraceae bacterium]|nr:hypothetical protein [Lachnospiraceae bacterium]